MQQHTHCSAVCCSLGPIERCPAIPAAALGGSRFWRVGVLEAVEVRWARRRRRAGRVVTIDLDETFFTERPMLGPPESWQPFLREADLAVRCLDNGLKRHSVKRTMGLELATLTLARRQE